MPSQPPQDLPAGVQAILFGMLISPLRLSGKDILEGEGPGLFRKRPAACPTRLGLGSPPPPEPEGQVNIMWKLSWECLITSMLHDEASPFLEFILAN